MTELPQIVIDRLLDGWTLTMRRRPSGIVAMIEDQDDGIFLASAVQASAEQALDELASRLSEE